MGGSVTFPPTISDMTPVMAGVINDLVESLGVALLLLYAEDPKAMPKAK
jgi:hypothetical protein